MNRTPPIEVIRQLRTEVGFGCPVPGCGNPYLYWHHFDPPWHEREHHNPSGMIALCGEHHAKADAGAFTKEQLHVFKQPSDKLIKEIKGKFDWMRRSLLSVVGGNFYFETSIIVEFRGKPIIWFNRDEEGYFLLNLKMLSTSNDPRIQIQDNFWLQQGIPSDLECPPSGKLLRVEYPNEDKLRIEFIELTSQEVAKKRYANAGIDGRDIQFPITAVEVYEKIGGTDIEFGPNQTTLPGHNIIKNCFIRNCRAGLSFS